MAINAERRAILESEAQRAGLALYTHSPGDGVTRYRFFVAEDLPVEQDYFGPLSGGVTVLGFKAAERFVSEVLSAAWLAGRPR